MTPPEGGPPVFIGRPTSDEGVRPRAGIEHSVSGVIASAVNCPEPLAGKVVTLSAWYLLPDGEDWKVPRQGYNFGAYGYDRLVRNGRDLIQGRTVGQAVIARDCTFTISWKEVILPNRTPYISDVYHVTGHTLDPTDPLGFRKITVRKTYSVAIQFQSSDGSTWAVHLSPQVHVEFYGNETEKQLPPMRAVCAYVAEV